MSERETFDSMDAQLRDVAPAFLYPPTPDVASAVRQRLPRGGAQRKSAGLPLPRLSWGLVALLALLLLAVLMSVPQVQAFVRSLFRIGVIEVVVVTPTPVSILITPEPSATPSYPLDLVGETTLAIANEEMPFAIKLPTYPGDLGRPDRVFVQDLDGTALILAWTEPGRQDQARLVLYELSPGINAEKNVSDYTVLQETTVRGRHALWITGSHWLQFYDSLGIVRSDSHRLVVGNVLLWEAAGITYRLESALSMAEAVRIAESLAPAQGIETPSPERTRTPPEWARNLASATTLDKARKRVPFPVRWPAYPASLGEPDLVFFQERAGPLVVLAWYTPVHHERVQTLLYQMAEGTAAQETFGGGGVPVEATVHGHAARWFRGSHLLGLYDEGGTGNIDSQRFVRGNVLLWEEEGVAYRLETPSTLDEAIRVAESVVR